jgi:hypothetical protein
MLLINNKTLINIIGLSRKINKIGNRLRDI